MNKKARVLTCAALLTAMSTTAFAAEATDTSAELNDLKARLAALEQRIDAQDKALKASEEELAKYRKNTTAAPTKMMTGNSTVTRVSAPFSLTEMTASISSSVSVSTWKNASEKMLHSV